MYIFPINYTPKIVNMCEFSQSFTLRFNNNNRIKNTGVKKISHCIDALKSALEFLFTEIYDDDSSITKKKKKN